MNKMISMLVLLVLVLPLTIGVLFTGPGNIMSACQQFFGDLLVQVTRFGAT